MRCRTILLLNLLCWPAVRAQSQQDMFDDLARRAEAALDSRPAEAAQLYKQALALHPNWVEGWFYLGAALYQLGRYVEAADALRRAVSLAPSHGTARALLGLSEAELGDPDQALADLREGEELGLGNNLGFEVGVRVRAAKLLILSSSFDEAMVQLKPLSKKKPDIPEIVETMGLCVLAWPARFADLAPEKQAVVNMAGQAAWYGVSERPEQATATYRQLAERYPDEPGVHYARGLFLIETDLAAAQAEFEKEVQGNPKHWPALIVLASLYVRQGDPESSRRCLRAALPLVPLRYRWLCHAELGRASLTAGKLEDAIAELRTAVWLKPSVSQPHFMLADAYRRAGRKEEAQKENAEFQRLKAVEDPLSVPGMRK